MNARLSGNSLATIAASEGISQSTVRDDLMVVAKLKYQGLIEKDELLLMTQNSLCEQLLEKWIKLALIEDLNVGETRVNRKGEKYDITIPAWESSSTATDKVIKLMEHMARINGLMAHKGNDLKESTELGTSIAMGILDAFSKRGVREEKVIDAEFSKDQGQIKDKVEE